MLTYSAVVPQKRKGRLDDCRNSNGHTFQVMSLNNTAGSNVHKIFCDICLFMTSKSTLMEQMPNLALTLWSRFSQLAWYLTCGVCLVLEKGLLTILFPVVFPHPLHCAPQDDCLKTTWPQLLSQYNSEWRQKLWFSYSLEPWHFH